MAVEKFPGYTPKVEEYKSDYDKFDGIIPKESKLKVVNLKVLSYCSDIPEEYHYIFQDYTCGIYIPYSLSDDPKYDQSELELYLMKEFPELVNTEFLIDMDY